MTLDTMVLGNRLMAWLLAGGIAVGGFFALMVMKSFLVRRIEAIARTTETRVDDLVGELLGMTGRWFVALLAIYGGSLALALPARASAVMGMAVTLAVIYQSALWFLKGIAFVEAEYGERKAAGHPGAAASVRALGFLSRFALGALAVLLALDNLGVDITALVAGLGIGGVAVALAVQNILGDLFASLSILFDRPFVLGDFIVVGDFNGTVERIGLKTTRLRSLSGEQIIFSNSDLLGGRVRNYKRMAERRVVLTVGVTYDTPDAKLHQIPGILRGAIETRRKVRFDRAHFRGFGPSSLDYEAVYFVMSAEYNDFADVQEAVGFAVLTKFRELAIEFAYPTQTLHVATVPAPGARP